MLIDTKPFGQIEVDPRQEIHLQRGLFGFDDYLDFVLLDAQQAPFYWLQSKEERDVAFVLINPLLFRPDYRAAVPQEDLEALGVSDEKDESMLLFAIVTIPEDQSRMTANLQGPLLINRKLKQGRQVISSDDRWQVRHVIMEEMKAARDRAC